MCGIAGIIHRDGSADIGTEMTSHAPVDEASGPGLERLRACSGSPSDLVVIRFKLADANDPRDFDFKERLERHRQEVETRLSKIGASIDRVERETEYAYRATVRYDGDMKALADYLEDVPGLRGALARALARDRQGPRRRAGGLEPVRARRGSRGPTRSGTSGWPPSPTSTSRARTRTGRIRSPTSRSCTTASSRTTSSGSGAWSPAGTGSSPSATRRSSRSTSPRRWPTAPPSKDAMHESLEDLDGVFTYMAVTQDASAWPRTRWPRSRSSCTSPTSWSRWRREEIAIRALIDHEIDTYDPYERAGAGMDR